MAVYSCGNFSNIVFTNPDEEFNQGVSIDGFTYYVPAYGTFMFPCYGSVNVVLPVSPQVGMIIVPGPLPELHNVYAFSFLFGLMTAVAFAVASARRWF